MRRARVAVGIVLLASLGLSGCMRGGLSNAQVQAWVGRPSADLEKTWGPPTREVDDAGQRVLIYEEVERNSNTNFEKTVTARQAGSAAAAAAANAAITDVKVYARSYLFWVDSAGAIVRAQIRQP
jgi:hypothetical protein